MEIWMSASWPRCEYINWKEKKRSAIKKKKKMRKWYLSKFLSSLSGSIVVKERRQLLASSGHSISGWFGSGVEGGGRVSLGEMVEWSGAERRPQTSGSRLEAWGLRLVCKRNVVGTTYRETDRWGEERERGRDGGRPCRVTSPSRLDRARHYIHSHYWGYATRYRL